MLLQNLLKTIEGKALQGLNSPARGDALGFECDDYILNPEGVAPGLRIYSLKKEFNPFRVVCLSLLKQNYAFADGFKTKLILVAFHKLFS